ncbi:MAG: serine/threonine-protein kinase [Minicystis sp.]
MSDPEESSAQATVTVAATDAGSAATVMSAPAREAAGAPALPPRYRDAGRLASGGFGEVRRVIDTALDRTVAMKILHADVAARQRVVDRFLAEVKLTAGLAHPGIVAVHDWGRLDDGRLWFTMREVRGRTLGEVIEEVHAAAGEAGFRETRSGWTFRRLVDAFARVCQAVAYAHRRGVVHRDLKPDNVMVGELGDVLVMDWGLGRRLVDADEDPEPSPSAPASDAPHLTQHGDVLGTPAYMPPEQALGQRELHGPPSDVYALGAILYDLLAGRAPYKGTAVSVLRQVIAGPPPPVADAALPRRVPEELSVICERAMRRENRRALPGRRGARHRRGGLARRRAAARAGPRGGGAGPRDGARRSPRSRPARRRRGPRRRRASRACGPSIRWRSNDPAGPWRTRRPAWRSRPPSARPSGWRRCRARSPSIPSCPRRTRRSPITTAPGCSRRSGPTASRMPCAPRRGSGRTIAGGTRPSSAARARSRW